MPDLNEPDVVLPLSQRLHDAVDAVAGQSEDDLDAPVVNRVDEDVSRSFRHFVISASEVFRCRTPPAGHTFSRCSSSRSEEHTSELTSLLRHSYAVFCLK